MRAHHTPTMRREPIAISIRQNRPILPRRHLQIAWLALLLAAACSMTGARLHAATSLLAILTAASLTLDEHPTAKRHATLLIALVVLLDLLTAALHLLGL